MEGLHYKNCFVKYLSFNLPMCIFTYRPYILTSTQQHILYINDRASINKVWILYTHYLINITSQRIQRLESIKHRCQGQYITFLLLLETAYLLQFTRYYKKEVDVRSSATPFPFCGLKENMYPQFRVRKKNAKIFTLSCLAGRSVTLSRHRKLGRGSTMMQPQKEKGKLL